MLFRFLSTLLASKGREATHNRDKERKLTPKEKDMLEYKLWEIAEEFEEED